MVDEFQDTDAVQVRFLLWLQRTFECTLFVVGDVKQSIYRFRGADYTAFEQLHEGLPPNSYRKITLKKNYRTGEKLLEEFDQYFSLWGEKIKGFPYSQEDRLQAMRQDIEGELIIKRFKFDTVFKEVLAQLEGTETAILVRSNQDILEIVQRCEELGFFCEGKISGNFYRSLPVRELYLLIRFLLLPQSASTYYALHRSSFGDNTLSNQEIIDQFQPNRRYVADLLANQPDHKYWNEILRLRHTIPPIVLLEKIIREREPHKTYVKRLWQRILSEQSDRNLNYIQELCRQKMIEYQNQLQYLMFILKRHFSDSVATLYGIEHFLRIQIATNHEENGPEKDNLVHSEIKPFQCMTVHKAKGLEFDHVILPLTRSPFISEKRPHIFIRYDFDRPQVAYQLELQGRRMSNSIFSQLKDTERLELVAEEVRLLYVAMTRAKKKLFIQTPIYDRNNRRNSWAELLGWRGEVSVV
jgi:DNA helicase-2/ATP-dependent DNA helicase PcrA